ncbi:MAG: type I 3-dehydroquinate dehydratase [Deltaproteobacteria bacterium]|nr:type I 3-dehydroquinate dehydratase [Deltaproteobacteria bacterium]
MKTRGKKTCLKSGKAPKVAGVIAGSIGKRAIEKAKKDGADLIEVRLDTLRERDPERLKGDFKKKLRPAGLPILLTIRSRKEGGRYAIGDRERLALFREIIPFADAVDIELGSKKIIGEVIKTARGHRKTVIVSYHNFRTTPRTQTLERIIKDARRRGADAVKIATLAKTREHILRLIGVLPGHRDMIAVAMGRYGRMSRVVFPFLGSLVTYGAITETTAPGQFTLKELKKALSFFNG